MNYVPTWKILQRMTASSRRRRRRPVSSTFSPAQATWSSFSSRPTLYMGWKNSEKSILQCINQLTTRLLLNPVGLRGEGRDGVGASEQRDDTATFAGPLVLRVGAGHTRNNPGGIRSMIHDNSLFTIRFPSSTCWTKFYMHIMHNKYE